MPPNIALNFTDQAREIGSALAATFEGRVMAELNALRDVVLGQAGAARYGRAQAAGAESINS